jgi:anti-sigma-K factor RskA
MTRHEQVNEMLAGLALGALNPDEEAEARIHIRECSVCAADLAAMSEVASALPLTVDEVEAPASLRQRVHEISATDAGTKPAPPRIVRFFPRPRRPGYVGLTWAAAAAIAIGLVGWNVSLQRQLSQNSGELAQLRNQVQHRALVSPGNGNVGSIAYLAGDRLALLSLHGLTRPEAGKAYELWVIPTGDQPVPAGTFLPDEDGNKLLVIPHQLAAGDQIAVTVELAAGSLHPTSTPVATAKI